jgi:PmbA protein
MKKILPSTSPKPRQTQTKAQAQTPAQAHLGLTSSSLQTLTQDVLVQARQQGVSHAIASVSESMGLSVSVRQGQLETIERHADKSLAITVYVGKSSGSASTCDFSQAAIAQTIEAARDIARFTAKDPHAGLPDEQDLAQNWQDPQLFFPWAIDASQATDLALACEQAALDLSPQVTNSEGATTFTQQGQFWMANTLGFSGGYASSRHGLSVAPIAGQGEAMQRDAWYTSQRDALDLAAPQSVGRYAAQRALSRLNARRLSSRHCPVLFESPLAVGLLGAYVRAVSGSALYRHSSFLLGSLGQSVWADHVDIHEDPFVPKGNGSSPFDDEGVRTHARQVLKAGVCENYFLSSYSARKLGLRTTGHAGGSHNLSLTSRLTRPEDDLPSLITQMGTGLLVTELMGQGINEITGDYSRAAFGFWVENGEIAYPVQEITIAGNLKDMFKRVVAVGHDAYTYGAKTTGSILIESLHVAGQ